MRRKSLAGVEIKGDARGDVAAVIATFGAIDADGDVVLPGAFAEGEQVVLSNYNHGSWQPGGLPVGIGEIRTSATEAIFHGRFFLSTNAGRETFEVVKAVGDRQQWSWGYDILHAEPGQQDGRQVQFLAKVKVHEVSPVLLGASVGTRTLAVKSQDPAGEHALEVWDRGMRLPGEREHELYVEASATTETARAARAAMTAASIDLGLKHEPTLVWFAPAAREFPHLARRDFLEALGVPAFAHPSATGLAYPSLRRIAIDSTLDPEEVTETVAHEVFHIATGGGAIADRAEEERAAHAYGSKVRAALEPVSAWIKRQEPRVHELPFDPGHASHLAGVAEPGDLLKAPDGRRVLARCYVNVGSSGCPSWRRVS